MPQRAHQNNVVQVDAVSKLKHSQCETWTYIKNRCYQKDKERKKTRVQCSGSQASRRIYTIAEHAPTPWQMLSQPSGLCCTASSKPLKTKALAFSETYGSLTHNKRIRFNPLTGRQKAKYCIRLLYESTRHTKVTFGSH